ncbi:MAG: hypothetical protein RLZZ618_1036 [Pseudomonadota bacterium]|jgi:serine/threonine protein phosphatase PrpC
MLEVKIASRAEVGDRHHNEDDLRFGSTGSFRYAVLSDGAGGHQGGEVASDLVVRLTALGLQSASQASPEFLTQLVCDTHAQLGRQQVERKGHERMHATLVALWIDLRREEALWTHVGDSRLYRLHHGRVADVTQDDSVVQRMVDAGYLSREEARDHPRKNQLLSAMGTAEPVEPNTVPAPVPIADGDAFLLCSDGWWDELDNAAIEHTFAEARSPEDWLARMATIVAKAATPRQDNYSAVAVWVGDPAEITRVDDLS